MRFSARFRRAGTWFAVCIAVAAVFRVTRFGHVMHLPNGWHVALHVLVFGCLAVLLTTSIKSPWKRLFFLLAVALLGLATEGYESLRNGLRLEGLDVLEDIMGAAGGLLLGEAVVIVATWMWRRRRLRTWEDSAGSDWV